MHRTILAGLTPRQAEAASLDGAVLVLAGAGTGKTRTLTAGVAWRIGARGIDPDRILAVTFTNKAAKEMADRIRTLLAGRRAPSWIGTFHGLGARQLRIEPEVATLRHGFDILDADDSRRLLKRTLKAMNVSLDDAAGRDPLKRLSNRIASIKDQLVTPDEASAHVEGLIAKARAMRGTIDPEGCRLAARVYLEYQQRLREANAADFGDLLLWPAKTMQRDLAYRRRWAERFDCVLTDEYQDVCYAQYAWLRLLAARHGEIFAVGDDDQAVYSFRGADIAHIRHFAGDFPRARKVRLEDNFRSTGHILAAANGVIARDPGRLGKTLRATKPMGVPVGVVGFSDPPAEAAGLVAEIKRRRAEGADWHDMAVLYRSSYMSRPFGEALMRAQVPYVIVSDVGFYQRAEIKDALALLRLAARPEDHQFDEAFRRMVNVPARGLGPKAMEEIHDEAAFSMVPLFRALETARLPPKARAHALGFIEAVRSVTRDHTATLADQLSMLVDRTGYRAMLRESRAEETVDRLENLQELLTLAGGFHTATELLDHAALASAAPGETVDGRVQLMTLHKGKGLEFPHVLSGHPFTLVLSLILAASVSCADTQSGMTIISGALSRDQQSVELRMRDGRTLRRLNRENFGFDGIHISPDHQTLSWNVLYNLGSAHFIYPVSTGVEVWRLGAWMDRIIYCEDAVLSHWWFWAGGRQIVLDCDTAHGPPSEHHLLFDVTSDKQLGEVRYDDRTRAPIGPEAGWSILQTRMGDGPAAR